MPKYNSIDNTPAKVFFDIMKTKNYQLLKPKPREKGLEAVYIAIYDEFFLRSDNFEAKEYLRLNNEIKSLESKIINIKSLLHFYFYNQTTQKMREEFRDWLLNTYNIELDLSKPFVDEVERVLLIEIGIINNDLVLLKADFNQMIAKSKLKDFDYFDSLVGIGNVLQGNNLVKEDITLALYVSLEKAAVKSYEQQTKKAA